MIEVEIRAKIKNSSEVGERLGQKGATLLSKEKQVDRVFGHQMFLDDNKMIVEGGLSARIRQTEKGVWLEFKEISRQKGAGVEIKADLDDLNEGLNFFEKLGFEESFTIAKERQKYSLNGFEICLDKVEQLGDFIEIERSVLSPGEVDDAKKKCLGLLEEIAPEGELTNRKYGDLIQEILNKN